jgi:hypothetical protein
MRRLRAVLATSIVQQNQRRTELVVVIPQQHDRDVAVRGVAQLRKRCELEQLAKRCSA